MEPGPVEPARAEPEQVEPGRQEPAHAEADRAEPGRAEPGPAGAAACAATVLVHALTSASATNPRRGARYLFMRAFPGPATGLAAGLANPLPARSPRVERSRYGRPSADASATDSPLPSATAVGPPPTRLPRRAARRKPNRTTARRLGAGQGRTVTVITVSSRAQGFLQALTSYMTALRERECPHTAPPPQRPPEGPV